MRASPAPLPPQPDFIIGNYRWGGRGPGWGAGWGLALRLPQPGSGQAEARSRAPALAAHQPVHPRLPSPRPPTRCALPPRACPDSDGNLVATLMSHRMNVTQCNIAHALEKTK